MELGALAEKLTHAEFASGHRLIQMEHVDGTRFWLVSNKAAMKAFERDGWRPSEGEPIFLGAELAVLQQFDQEAWERVFSVKKHMQVTVIDPEKVEELLAKPRPPKGPETMTFDKAKKFIMFIGKHKGKTLDEIARTDDGLRYMDWMAGQDWVQQYGDLYSALVGYLGEPAIAEDLGRITQ